MQLNPRSLKELIRYVVVGIVNNSLGYLIYLAITWLGVEPKLAVTLLYPIAAVTAYFGHASYSFSFRGGAVTALARYSIAHFIGYAANLLLLFTLHDKMHLPHQLVQIFAICAVAGLLFLLFKYFVFPKSQQNGQREC